MGLRETLLATLNRDVAPLQPLGVQPCNSGRTRATTGATDTQQPAFSRGRSLQPSLKPGSNNPVASMGCPQPPDATRREWVEERAGILQFDAGLVRGEAERYAHVLANSYFLH
jgi:hypothetical protein